MIDSTTLAHSDHGPVTGYYKGFSCGFCIVLHGIVFICIYRVTLHNIGQVRTIYEPYQQTIYKIMSIWVVIVLNTYCYYNAACKYSSTV